MKDFRFFASLRMTFAENEKALAPTPTLSVSAAPLPPLILSLPKDRPTRASPDA